MPSDGMRAYCGVCEWAASTDDGDLSRVDVSHRAIRHHVRTGHLPIETTCRN